MKIHIIGCSGSGKTYLANALSKKYNNDEWIIKGVYYAWVHQCFDEGDKIYVLDMPGYLYKSRIIIFSTSFFLDNHITLLSYLSKMLLISFRFLF